MKYLQVSFVLAWVVVLLLLSMLSFLLEDPLLVSRKRLNLHVQYVLTLLNLVRTWPNPNLFMRQTKLGTLSSWIVWRLSQLSLYEWVWINQLTCSTIHLLQMDRMLILSWDMGNIQQIKKKHYSRQKMLTNLYSSLKQKLGETPNFTSFSPPFPLQ